MVYLIFHSQKGFKNILARLLGLGNLFKIRQIKRNTASSRFLDCVTSRITKTSESISGEVHSSKTINDARLPTLIHVSKHQATIYMPHPQYLSVHSTVGNLISSFHSTEPIVKVCLLVVIPILFQSRADHHHFSFSQNSK